MKKYWALFSGGKDSFAVASWLQERDLLHGLVLIDTGISVPGWEEITRSIGERLTSTIEVYRTNIRYEWLIWKYGFPGHSGHRFAMNYLKGRAIREFKKAHPDEALASGVRQDESSRRAVTTKEIGTFEGVKIWAPLYDKSTEEVWAYVRGKGYERPKSYITLGTSGDCLCGAYAMPHERDAIAEQYPEVDQRLCKLERECQIRHPTRCRWGWMNEKIEKTAEEFLICVECKREVEG